MGTGFFLKGFGEVVKEGIRKSRCITCGRKNKNTHTSCFPVEGQGKKKILIIYDCPLKIEDESSTFFTGKRFNYISKGYEKYTGGDVREDCWFISCVACYGGNLEIKPAESSICGEFLRETIQELEPRKILSFGKVALGGILGDDINVDSFGRWVGTAIPDQKIKSWVFPNWGFDFFTEDEKNKSAVKILLKNAFKKAITHDKVFPNYGKEKERVEILNEIDAVAFLDSLDVKAKKEDFFLFSFDFETTGLKPHRFGHKVVCVGVAVSYWSSVCFPYYESEKFKNSLRRVFRNKKIRKTAHNIKFEACWTKNIFGYEVKGWAFDTMVVSHILNNQPKETNLDHQVYVNYGNRGYSGHIKSFFDPKPGEVEKSGNAFNKIYDCNSFDLMIYCGLDALYGYRLAVDQKKECKKRGPGIKQAIKLFMEGTLGLIDVEQKGIRADKEHYEKEKIKAQETIKKLLFALNEDPGVKKWKKKNPGRDLNLLSDIHIKSILYDFQKHTPTLMTKKGNISINEEVLNQIGTNFTKNLLLYRKQMKLVSTYLDGFIREIAEDPFGREIIHGNIDLSLVLTFRSSASNPNLQNIPARNKKLQKITRSGIVASPGFRLLSVDYKGIEVCSSACVHKDPAMIKYVTDPATDMHRDVAMDLFLLFKEEVEKDIRFTAKNGFVFAEFYGDFYKMCARRMWPELKNLRTTSGIPLLKHLKSKGIKNYFDFERHVKKVEKKFWNIRFRGYRDWKEKTWEEYLSKGYIDYVTGFRVSGLMKKNEVLNYPIQGPAFHCLLWSLIRLNKISKKEKWKSKINNEIHDELIWEIEDNELEMVKPIIRKVMCEDIRKEWPWIIVPLNIDAEVSEVGGNWFDMKEIDI